MNKTIAINPELFKLSNTQKKQPKPASRTIKNKPIISSNVIKNKLLKRIKKYKFNESKARQTNPLKLKNQSKHDSKTSFSDEFSESLDFLKSLEKSKPINSQLSTHNLTMKHARPAEPVNVPQELVNIDLPNELVETKFEINNNDVINSQLPLMNIGKNDNIIHLKNESLNSKPPLSLNKPDHDVPYGVLKNGRKPTYRQWTHTQKNVRPFSEKPSNQSNNTDDSKNTMNDREKKLSELRLKLSKPLKTNTTELIKNDWENENYIVNPNKNNKLTEHNIDLPEIKNDVASYIQKAGNVNLHDINDLNSIQNMNKRDPKKHYNKVTKVRRKYTLGKSKLKNKVSMLVKNNATRKKVLDAHKNLKKTSLHEIKQYLKDHNLIKIGSQSPNYILRKIYENAKLSGDVSNVNKKTLLDNILTEYKDAII